MLQIGITIAVVIWFFVSAQKLDRNRLVWAIVGAVSYYVPSVIFGRFIFPALIGTVELDDLGGYLILGVVLSVATGLACCLIARGILLKSG
ncbi:MAG: hypothetical protein KDA64_06245 [Rhodospirillaceae bacterium]|nr:hypothetical protein [Rhodospirillaceae bacterium]